MRPYFVMFNNREDAGKQLGLKIKSFFKEDNYIVAAITRGGIVVGKVIADFLKTSFRAIVIKKIGAPYNSELAIGAVGSGKTIYWDNDLVSRLNIDDNYKLLAVTDKFKEIKKLEKIFNIDKKRLDFKDKRVILVDDGVATGATVLCAQKVLQMQGAKEIILAVPVISQESYILIEKYFDNIIALESPLRFSAVGEFYRDFPQVEDKEVIKRLRKQGIKKLRA